MEKALALVLQGRVLTSTGLPLGHNFHINTHLAAAAEKPVGAALDSRYLNNFSKIKTNEIISFHNCTTYLTGWRPTTS